MKEQVELEFMIKGEVEIIQDLVEILNKNHLVEILTVTDGSEDRKLAGPVFLYIPNTYTPLERWEYKVAVEPTWARQEDMEEWLNKLGSEGWQVLRIPDDADGFWYFRRKSN